MSKRSRRRSTGNWPTLIALLIIACAAGWYLLRPLAHQRTTVAPNLAAGTASTPPAAVEQPTQVPTTLPTASSATPTATPTPSVSVPNATGPKLALIVDDCGQWLDIERGFIALPVPLTLSVLPHVHGTEVIAQEAHDAGKGVMLHLPMEPVSEIYPGPGEVKTSMSDAQVTAQVQDDLAQVPFVQGVNNHEGSKASADSRVMHDVMQVLAQHGQLFFIDSRTSSVSVGAAQAHEADIPAASRDVFLDNRASVDYTEAQLREAAAIAKRTGSAIAIGHPRPTTLAAVRAMIPELQAQGIQFVLAGTLTH